MPTPRHSPHLRASLLAVDLCEGDAVCHENIADDIADLIAGATIRWRGSPAAFVAVEPDPGLVFASIADVMADLFCGLSSGYLQAVYAARSSAP